MKTRGALIFDALRRALGDVHADAARWHEAHQRLDEQLKQLVARRGETVLELAAHYLPDFSRETVEKSFQEIRDELRAILERRNRQVQELQGRAERLRAAAAATVARIAAATTAAANAIQSRDQAQREVAQQLAETPEFQMLSRATLASEAELRKDEERVTQIRQEATEKLPAYQQSSLFRYLQRRNFGTPDDGSRGIFRRLDRWLARVINYSQASRSYRFLKATPLLMQQEMERRREEFHRQMDRLELLNADAAGARGLAEHAKAADDAERELSRLAQTLRGDEERVRAVEQELAELTESQGRFYAEALARFRSFLAAAETGLLESKAASTSEPGDDEIVGRLRVIADELEEIQPRVAQMTAESQAADRRSEGLDFIVRRFEQANFHEERSFFEEGFDIDPLLAQYRAGAFDKDAFWAILKRSQQRELTDLEKRASEAAKTVTNSSLSGALVEAMIKVAGAALSDSVGRSIGRRSR